MEDLNVRQETIKIPEEKTGNNLFDLGHSNFLLDMSPEARETKAKVNSWDHIKIKKKLQEKTCSNLIDLSCSNFLLDMSLKAREIKAKMNY